MVKYRAKLYSTCVDLLTKEKRLENKDEYYILPFKANSLFFRDK